MGLSLSSQDAWIVVIDLEEHHIMRPVSMPHITV